MLQYKESECELEQNKPASAAISSVIRSDYNTDSRFQGNEQYLDPESEYHIIFISFLFLAYLYNFFLLSSSSPFLPDKLRLILRMLKMWNECVIFINFLLQTFHFARVLFVFSVCLAFQLRVVRKSRHL